MAYYERNFFHEIWIADEAATGGAAVDANGDPTSVSVQRKIVGRVEESVNVVKNQENKEVQTTHIVYCADRAIKPGARMWFPHLGDVLTDPGDARPVAAVRGTSRLRRPHDTLTKVYL